jgi:hypothetical protein
MDRSEGNGMGAKARFVSGEWQCAQGYHPHLLCPVCGSGRSKRTFLPGSARFRVLSQEKPAKMLNFSKFGLEKPDGTPTSDPSLYSVQS